MDIKGFKSRDGSKHQYDYNALANKPDAVSGKDGGYYTPAVTQLDEKTVQFDFTPSKEGMPAVESVTVELPVGEDSGENLSLDNTLTQSGAAADAKAVGDALNELEGKIPEGGKTTDYSALTNKPSINGVEVSGDKTAEDYGIGQPTTEQISSAVSEWLDEHPEATTTVPEDSVTMKHLSMDIVNVTEPPEAPITGAITALDWTSGNLNGSTDDEVSTSGGSYSRLIDVTPGSVLHFSFSSGATGDCTVRHYNKDGVFLFMSNASVPTSGAGHSVGCAEKVRLQTGSAWQTSQLTASLEYNKPIDTDESRAIKSGVIDIPGVAEAIGIEHTKADASVNLYNDETMGFKYQPGNGANLAADAYNDSTTIKTVLLPVNAETEYTVTLASAALRVNSFAYLVDADFNVLFTGSSAASNTTCPYTVETVNVSGVWIWKTHTLKADILAKYPDTAYLGILTTQAGTDYETMMAVAGGYENLPAEYVPYREAVDRTTFPALTVTADNLDEDLAILLSGSSSELPVMHVYGDTTGMTKDVEKSLTYVFKSKSKQIPGFCTMKWQGSSSIQYDKKNYTIKLYRDAANTVKNKRDMDLNAGKQHKYCLKANYIDHTHSRNIVNARLWGDIVNLRTSVHEHLEAAPNMGAVDGYPFLMYINGEYHGLYTWNIPKDGYMFDMDGDDPLHCVVCAESNGSTSECAFRVASVGQWSVEFPDAYTDTTKSGLLNLINFVMSSTDEEFVGSLDTYLDVQSAIDYYIFAYVSCNIDGLGKNMILLTYDAVRWICSAYDLDSTWGLFWNGSKLLPATTACPENYQMSASLLWERIEALFPARLYARYRELRATALSEQNITDRFKAFCGAIPNEVYKADADMYAIPLINSNNLSQLLSFIPDRLAYCDEQFEAFNVF